MELEQLAGRGLPGRWLLPRSSRELREGGQPGLPLVHQRGRRRRGQVWGRGGPRSHTRCREAPTDRLSRFRRRCGDRDAQISRQARSSLAGKPCRLQTRRGWPRGTRGAVCRRDMQRACTHLRAALARSPAPAPRLSLAIPCCSVATYDHVLLAGARELAMLPQVPRGRAGGELVAGHSSDAQASHTASLRVARFVYRYVFSLNKALSPGDIL